MRTIILAMVASVSMSAVADDYSTMGTFTMVSNCMIEAGGQTEENLYMCSCRADVIKATMSEQEYENALTVEKYRQLPADKGAVFRDTKKGQDLYDALRKVRKKSEETCPAIKTVKPIPRSIQQ